MPPKKSNQIHLVVERSAEGGIENVVAAYNSDAAAQDAVTELGDEAEFDVLPVELKEDPKPAKKAAAKSTKAAPKKAKAEPEEDENGEDDGEEKPNTKKKAPEKRKQPAGDGTGPFAGMSLMFTGTFDVDRKTCEALAVENGAKLVSVLKKADFIVLGKKPGPKKVDEINAEGYKTWSEEEFNNKLNNKKQKN